MVSWIKKYLSEADVAEIEYAVRGAEMRTQAEIVPMIVKSSVINQSSSFLLFLIMLVIFLLNELVFHFAPSILVAMIFAPLAYYFSRLDFLKRFLITEDEQDRSVRIRAELEFYRHQFQNTENKNCVLIFVSLFEREVIVLADKAVTKILPDDTWQIIVNELIVHIRNKNMRIGLVKTISLVADILEKHFPAQQVNKNEIGDKLIMID